MKQNYLSRLYKSFILCVLLGTFMVSPSFSQCPAPTGLITTNPTENSIVLAWNEIADATEFEIRYRVINSNVWESVIVADNIVTLSGLTSGTEYYWKVQSTCSDLSSATSPLAIFSTQGSSACPTPISLVSSAFSDNGASLQWSSVSGAVAYNIKYKVINGSVWSDATSSSNSYNLSGLVSGTEYVWKVSAVCTSDNSLISDFSGLDSFMTTGESACPVPASISVLNVDETSAEVQWDAVGGAQGYEIRYRNANGSLWLSVETNTNNVVLSGLNTGTDYLYYVRALCSENKSLLSQFSEISGFTTMGDPACAAPGGLATLNLTNSSATLSWAAVGGDVQYEVRYRPNVSEDYIRITTSNSSVSLPGVMPSTKYVWSVRTICTSNSLISNFSESEFFTTPDLCAIPLNLTTTNLAEDRARTNWDIVDGAVSYTVRYRPLVAGDWVTTTTTTNTRLLSNLLSGTDYEWQVKTTCSNLESEFSESMFFRTTGDPVCDVPSNLNTTSVTDNTAQLAWNVATGVQNYEIRYRVSTSSTWQTTTSSTNSISLSGLSPGTKYIWTVKTNCLTFSSELSPLAEFTTTGISACPVPTALALSGASDNTANLTWSAVPGATNYEVRYRISTTTTWTSRIVSTNSIALTGLQAGSIYYWHVKTVCSPELSSPFTGIVSFNTTGTAPCNPATGMSTFNTTATSTDLFWNEVPGATYLVRYRLNSSSSFTRFETGTNIATLSNLLPNEKYVWSVRINCADGTSTWQNASFSTLAESESSFVSNSESKVQGNFSASNGDQFSINMFDNNLTIEFIDETVAKSEIFVYNAHGRLIKTIDNTINPALVNSVSFENITDKFIIVKVINEKSVSTKKLLRR